MNLEEFRKGNYIQEDDGLIWKVVGIGADTLSVAPVNSNLVCTTSFRNFIPIPLTEDIIKKCGFSEVGHVLYPKYRIEYTNILVKCKIELDQFDTDWFQWIEGNTIVNLRALHDLQNFFYVISGGYELEVKF